MNFLAIKLAHEAATGRRSVADARKEYARLSKAFEQGDGLSCGNEVLGRWRAAIVVSLPQQPSSNRSPSRRVHRTRGVDHLVPGAAKGSAARRALAPLPRVPDGSRPPREGRRLSR